MAGKTADLVVRIKTDTSQAKTDIDETAGAFSKMGSSFATAFNPAVVASGLAVVGAGLFKATMMASDLNETVSASGVIFGGASQAIQDFAKDSATTLGMSKTEAIAAANTFGALGKSAGLAGQDLTGFSTEMVQLATDLASMKNTSPEEAIQALGSAMRGEMEPIRKYDILLDDATLRQEALALGIVDTTKNALTPQQKILASQAAIMKRSVDAQGDFARTQGGMANQMRITTATLKNMAISIGEALLPSAEKFMGFLNAEVIPGLKSFAQMIGENDTAMTAIAAVIGTILLGAVISLTVALGSMAVSLIAATWPVLLVVAAVAALALGIKWLWDNVEPFRTAVEAAFKAIGDAVGPIMDSLDERFQSFVAFLNETFLPAVQAMWDNFKKLVDPIVGFIQEHWDSISEIFRNTLDIITNIISNAWQVISNIFQFFLNLIKGDWGAAWDNIKNILSAVWDTIQNVISNAFGIIRETVQILLDFFVDVAKGLWDWLWEGLEGAIKSVKDMFNGLLEFVKSIPRLIGDILSGLWDKMPKPPSWVPVIGAESMGFMPVVRGVGRTTAPLAAPASLGAPVPLSQQGMTVNVTIQHSGLAVDSPRLQRDIVDALRRYGKRNGRASIPYNA